MARRHIPCDTESFHYHNENQHGWKCGDCVIRAIATATGKTWDRAYRDLCEIGLKKGRMPNDKIVYGKLLQDLGWRKMKQPRKLDGTKYTGEEFCELLSRSLTYETGYEYSDRIIAHIGGHHVVAIMYGQVYDTWNSTYGCIGTYWLPPRN